MIRVDRRRGPILTPWARAALGVALLAAIVAAAIHFGA